jgi:ABC-type transport system substrate-binding protein
VRRRDTLALAGALALPGLGAGAQTPASAPRSAPSPDGSALRVLRVAFPIAETGFDPARIVDIYSRTITPHIFEGLYQYDHLARPALIKPLTAAAMPEVSADFRTWTVRIQPGIFFADDPAFGGRPRELVAADYVYSFKRPADPATKSPIIGGVLETGFVGLAELRDEALKNKTPFDYDRPIEGIRALDRYTVQFKTLEPRPRLIETLATSDLFGAVAREVVEKYGDAIPAHPVGTGPYRLAQWRRSSLIVLERSPSYREVLYDAQPADDDAEGQAVLKQLKGRRLPMVDRIEVSIIEETQPRWLAFLNAQIDYTLVPPEFANVAMPGGMVAPNLARQGIRGRRTLLPSVNFTFFNMEDPVVGGYTAQQVALRRAISLGIDVERENQVVFRGQAVPAQGVTMPHTTGYDPRFKSENSDFDPARAKALLDLYGFVDRNGDGWRELPDGAALELEIATQPDQQSRQRAELLQKNMTAIGIRVRFLTTKWPEQLKAARAGKLQMWSLGSSAAAPDGLGALARLYGPQAGSQNLARFRHAEFDKIYQRMQEIPDGAERDALFERAKRIAVAYMPYKSRSHPFANDMTHPWLIGHRRPLFWQEWWHMVDIDNRLRR